MVKSASDKDYLEFSKKMENRMRESVKEQLKDKIEKENNSNG